MGNMMTIFTPECAASRASVLRDVDRRGLQQAGRARMGGTVLMKTVLVKTVLMKDVPVGGAMRVASAPRMGSAMPGAGVRVSVEAHARGFDAVMKQLKTPVVIGVNGEVGPHPGRPPI